MRDGRSIGCVRARAPTRCAGALSFVPCMYSWRTDYFAACWFVDLLLLEDVLRVVTTPNIVIRMMLLITVNYIRSIFVAKVEE
jgi:hypothetical protein